MAGVVLVVISKGEEKADISPAVQNTEVSILREIELNNTLRAEILATNGIVDWIALSSQAPNTKTKIQSRIPNYLNCEAQICDPSGSCLLTGAQIDNVYVESIMITSTLDTFKPRMLKLFCWEK